MAKQKIGCAHIKENISQFVVSPLETGIPNFTKLVNYFEYKVAFYIYTGCEIFL